MTRKPRLSSEDWLRAGLDALSAAGPEALKAEPLARVLDTTKGSFYWHFPDVPHFRQALLNFWLGLVGCPDPAPEDRKEAVTRLHEVMRDGFSPDPAAESAMRAWARTDPDAARILAEIDRQRLEHLETLLGTLGVTNPDIARLLYAAGIGMGGLYDQDAQAAAPSNGGAMDTLVDLVLALR